MSGTLLPAPSPGRRAATATSSAGRESTETMEPAAAQPEVATDLDRPWITIVWNDPINLMSYVTHVFMTVFGYAKPEAEKLMMDVHQRGRAVVSSGTRERMELDVSTLHGYGLWATLEKQT